MVSRDLKHLSQLKTRVVSEEKANNKMINGDGDERGQRRRRM